MSSRFPCVCYVNDFSLTNEETCITSYVTGVNADVYQNCNI